MSDQQDLVGIPEIAERLSKSRRTVIAWRYRAKNPPPPPWEPFPTELMLVSGRPIWDWTDVEAWAKRTGRLQ